MESAITNASSHSLLQRILRRASLDVFDVDLRSRTMTRSGSLQDSLGLPATMKLSQFLSRVHDFDRIRFDRLLGSLSPDSPHYSFIYRFRDESGSFVCLQDDVDVIFDEHGTPVGLEGLSRDVTQETQVRQQLSREQQRLSLAMQASSMGSFEWDPESDRLIADDALHQLIEVEHGELDWGNQFFARMHPDDVERVKVDVAHVLESREIYQSEFRMIRPNGETFWLAGRGCVLSDDSGEIRHLVGINWDITQKKQMEFRLEKARTSAEAASESKTVFLANMSHEIRTPMTAILGYTDLAQSSTDPAERDEYLQTIRRNGYYLLEIINDILDISKIEAGKIETRQETFSPDRLIADVQSIMDVRARENDLELSVYYESALPNLVKSDPKRLKQILINLVGNAIKFTREGGVRIAVRHVPHPDQSNAEEGAEFLEIDVIDSGIGITSEQMAALFEPFHQGDARINRNFGGTGLGLAISQRLARILGGEIVVESQVGRGSKFTCRVAANAVPGAEMIRPGANAFRESPEKVLRDVKLNCHVLVVDDRRDIRFLSRGFLTKAGATVEEANDGLDALEKIEQALEKNEPFDCVILDMQMPRLDGYRTASQLRRKGYDKPIIALTAEAMDGDSNRCINAGCDDYLSKPIDAGRLLRMVARFTNPAVH